MIVEVDPNDKDSYLTPEGPRKFEHHAEAIKVKDVPDETIDVVATMWGPVKDRDHQDRPRVVRWVAHDPDGVHLGLARMESAPAGRSVGTGQPERIATSEFRRGRRRRKDCLDDHRPHPTPRRLRRASAYFVG